MASTKISALTTDSSPVRNTDFVPVYKVAGTVNRKVLLSDVGVIVYQMSLSVNVSPADSTTYCMSPFAAIGLTTSFANNKMYAQRQGLITRIRLFGSCTTGTSENVTVSFRLNDTTDTTITSTLQLNASPFTVENTSLSIAVAATDFFGIKIATPAWVTNPTNFNMHAQIYQS